MKQRRLGRNGPSISALGLGCMGFSPNTYGLPANEADSIRTVHRALDLGVNIIEERGLAECDAQAFHAIFETAQGIVRVHRGGRYVAIIGTLQRLIDERSILDRPRERSDAVERPAQWVDARAADSSYRRLQANDPAQRCGHPNRSTGVGAERHRCQTRSDGHRASTR